MTRRLRCVVALLAQKRLCACGWLCFYPMKGEVPDANLALWSLSYDFYVKQGSTLK